MNTIKLVLRSLNVRTTIAIDNRPLELQYRLYRPTVVAHVPPLFAERETESRGKLEEQLSLKTQSVVLT